MLNSSRDKKKTIECNSYYWVKGVITRTMLNLMARSVYFMNLYAVSLVGKMAAYKGEILSTN